MSLLIPWEQIVALGAIEESGGLKPGFAALSVESVGAEAPQHPSMLQGDHGPFAFRNIYVRPLRPIVVQ